MIKNKLDYKLLNFLIIVVTIFFLYQTKDLWLSLFNKSLAFLTPLLFGFCLAYALNPLLKYLMKLKIPKKISLIIIVVLVLGFLTLVFAKLLPILIIEILSLINYLKMLIENNNWSNSLLSIFDKINDNIWKYISSGITLSFSIVSNLIIALTTSIYFLYDMDKIRNWVLKKVKNKKLFCQFDQQINNYFKGLLLIMVITFFEYTTLYLIIKHPQALLLGILASLANLIPQFGGLIVHILSLLIAISISPNLIIKTLIVVLICSILDGYVINPLVYGRSNKIHPLIVIIAVLVGSVVAGFFGIILALPLALILIVIYNYYLKK